MKQGNKQVPTQVIVLPPIPLPPWGDQLLRRWPMTVRAAPGPNAAAVAHCGSGSPRPHGPLAPRSSVFQKAQGGAPQGNRQGNIVSLYGPNQQHIIKSNTSFINRCCFLYSGCLMFYAKFIVVATLVRYSMSLSNILSLCLLFMSLYTLSEGFLIGSWRSIFSG